MLAGTPVSLNDMLNCRERRAAYQQFFLSEYNCPLISFCLNIPGPIKTNTELRITFETGKIEIINLLHSLHIQILDSVEIHEITGDELILCIDYSAPKLKALTICIENTHALGRLFDIDIIDINGIKLSRGTFRKCLICDNQAQDCARSRNHTIAEMQQTIAQLLSDYILSATTVSFWG